MQRRKDMQVVVVVEVDLITLEDHHFMKAAAGTVKNQWHLVVATMTEDILLAECLHLMDRLLLDHHNIQ
jgi:hypothetical protein